MELAKKRDSFVPITDVAVEKAARAEIPEFTDKMNDELHRHHRELLRAAQTKNNSKEVLRIWNIHTGGYIDTFGSATKVTVDDNVKIRAFIFKSKPLSLAFLHNHPSTSSFSLADIDTFLRYNKICLMTVITNQGEVYYFYKTAQYKPLLTLSLYNHVVKKLGGAGVEVGDEFAKEFAKISRKGGVIYGRR